MLGRELAVRGERYCEPTTDSQEADLEPGDAEDPGEVFVPTTASETWAAEMLAVMHQAPSRVDGSRADQYKIQIMHFLELIKRALRNAFGHPAGGQRSGGPPKSSRSEARPQFAESDQYPYTGDLYCRPQRRKTGNICHQSDVLKRSETVITF